MKPVCLKMQAFGSYVKPEPIDFTRLTQNLFLIAGDTGAGKSTIFDAIVFALYGEASSVRNRREGLVLQSQFAPPEIEPYVELTFLAGEGGNERYTVRRVPRHMAVRRRRTGAGGALVEKAASVTLTMPDGSDYPAREADRKIEEIVGLSKGQFMQVAMIAQGEFMDLLRARSDDKKVIFRKLFGTDLYREVAEELMQRRRDLEGELKELTEGCRREAESVRIPADYARAEALETLKERLGESAGAALTEYIDELRLLEGALSAAEERDRDLAAEMSKKRDAARDERTKAASLLELFARRDQAAQRLTDMAQSQEEAASWLVLAAAVRKAWRLKQLHAVPERAALDEAQARQSLEEARQKLPAAQEEAQRLRMEEQTAREAEGRERETCSRVREKADRAVQLFDEAARHEAAVKQLRGDMAAAQQQEKKAAAASEQLRSRSQQCRSELEKLGNVAEQRARLTGRLEKAAELERLLARAKEEQKACLRREKEAGKAARTYAEARAEAVRLSGRYETARLSFLDAQAGLLAQTLVAGEPCPVCGSTSHPHPASGDTEKAPDRAALEALRAQTQAAAQSQEKASAASSAAAERLREKQLALEGTCAELSQRLTAGAAEAGVQPDRIGAAGAGGIGRSAAAAAEDRPAAAPENGISHVSAQPDDMAAEIARRRAVLDEESRAMEKREKDEARLQAELAQVTQQAEAADKAAADAAKTRLEAAGSLEAETKVLGQLLAGAPYATREEALASRKDAEQKLARAAEAAEKQRAAAQEAVKKTEALKERIRDLTQRLPELTARREETEADYRKALAESTLTEEAWQETVRAYPEEEAGRLETRAQQRAKEEAALKGQLESLEASIGAKARPDREAVENAFRASEQALAEAEKAAAQSREEAAGVRRARKALSERVSPARAALEQYRRVDRLCRLANGNLTDSRMDLETYVQRCFLEKILTSANRRFRELSGGEFELRMTNEESAGRGRNRGLDLMVYSFITGREREVRTLSGGESFMAALSLALGMADEIQLHSPSVRLDMMFIDEGFGSLDERSRTEAVRILQEMAGGDKLIGIISHVTELRQMMENQLIVSRDERGSHAQWRIS